MPYYYSDETRENDAHAQPNIWVTQLTSHEVAEQMSDEIYEFMKRPGFRLANMNSRVRDALIDAMVEELDIKGGFCWCYCFPGCLPDSEWSTPFSTIDEAVADMRESVDRYA
jgi:hypothetical protein